MNEAQQALFAISEIGLSIHHINKKVEDVLGLTLVQWCLLKKLIDNPGCQANQLAQSTGVQPASLTQSLKRLQRKKLIFIEQDERDFRKKIIVLTREGKKALDRSQNLLPHLSKNLTSIRSDLERVSKELKKEIGGQK